MRMLVSVIVMRCQMLWWWLLWDRALRDVRIRFHDDGCVAMNDDEWGRWLNRLPPREFLMMILQGDPRDSEDDSHTPGLPAG